MYSFSHSSDITAAKQKSRKEEKKTEISINKISMNRKRENILHRRHF